MGVEKYRTQKGVFWKIDEWLLLPDGTQTRLRKRRIPSKELATQFLAKARTAAFEGRYFEKQKEPTLTVKALWNKYQPVTERHNDSARNDKDRSAHLNRHLGSKLVCRLTVDDVEQYRTLRQGEKTKWGKTPAAGTLDREVSLLKRLCSYAKQAKLIPVNPLAGTSMINEPNTRDVVLSEDRFTRLYEAAESVLQPILVLAYDTGMRKREILDLLWDQVDLKARVIRLRAGDTKNEQPRLIVMTQRVFEALRDEPHHIRSPHVFVNPQTGKPYRDIRPKFIRACNAAGIKVTGRDGLWFHDLRRSFVTNARRRGVPESVVMRMSGHRTRSVFDRYNIVEEEDLREAVRRIEAGRVVELGEVEEQHQKEGSDDA